MEEGETTRRAPPGLVRPRGTGRCSRAEHPLRHPTGAKAPVVRGSASSFLSFSLEWELRVLLPMTPCSAPDPPGQRGCGGTGPVCLPAFQPPALGLDFLAGGRRSPSFSRCSVAGNPFLRLPAPAPEAASGPREVVEGLIAVCAGTVGAAFLRYGGKRRWGQR